MQPGRSRVREGVDGQILHTIIAMFCHVDLSVEIQQIIRGKSFVRFFENTIQIFAIMIKNNLKA